MASTRTLALRAGGTESTCGDTYTIMVERVQRLSDAAQSVIIRN